MNADRQSPARGFIALMSVVVISSVLLLLVTEGSFSGFTSRINSLNHEFKNQSEALAEACVQQALLEYAHNSSFVGNASSSVTASEECYVGSMSRVSSNPALLTFTAQAASHNAYTFYEITARVTDLKIVRFVELSSP